MERKKLLALLSAATILLTASGCSKKESKLDENGIPIRETLTEVHNTIDNKNSIKNYYTGVYEGDKAVIKYKADNIHYLINKNTYETMVIIMTGTNQADPGNSYKVYLVEDNNIELLAVHYKHVLIDDGGNNVDYWKYLLDQSYDIKLSDASIYLSEDFNMKSNYTYEELVNIGEQIIVGLQAVKAEEEKVNVK